MLGIQTLTLALTALTGLASNLVVPYNGTSAANCTKAECGYDVKVCNKVSGSCVQWIECISDHCVDSKVNDTKSDQCFTICLFQVDADGPTLELFQCAMDNCIQLKNNTLPMIKN